MGWATNYQRKHDFFEFSVNIHTWVGHKTLYAVRVVESQELLLIISINYYQELSGDGVPSS